MTCNDFRESIANVIDKFKRSRQTRFANSNKCDVNSIHVHNDKPIPYLVKQFKDANSIKSRVYKSLTPDQQSAWLSYYDSNKQLRIMTDEQHRQFHDTHKFDVKSGTFIESVTTTQVDSHTQSSITPTNVKSKQSVKSDVNSDVNVTKSSSKKSCKVVDKPTVESVDKSAVKTKRSTTKSNIHDSDNNSDDNDDEPTSTSTPSLTKPSSIPVTTTNVIKTKVARAKKSHK